MRSGFALIDGTQLLDGRRSIRHMPLPFINAPNRIGVAGGRDNGALGLDHGNGDGNGESTVLTTKI